MGAVFTIFLFAPLYLPTLAAEKILGLFGIDLLGVWNNILDLIELWLSANPELVEIIRSILIG